MSCCKRESSDIFQFHKVTQTVIFKCSSKNTQIKSYTITFAALSPAFSRLNTSFIFWSSNFGLFLPLSVRCVPALPSRGPESERHRCDRRSERRADLCHRWGAKASDTVEEKQSAPELPEPGRHQRKMQPSSLSDGLFTGR